VPLAPVNPNPDDSGPSLSAPDLKRVKSATSGGLSISVFNVERGGAARRVAGRESHAAARASVRGLFLRRAA
jgi:hypothetical protein